MAAELSTPCPPKDRLELLARDADGDPALNQHVAACSRCGQYVVRVRENEAFLRNISSLLPPSRPTTPENQLLPCETVPGYEILRELRRGGQGVVYQAAQLSAKRTVALKMLLSGPFASLKHRLRFEREVELIATLRHPNIVTVYDSGVTLDGRPYFAMEYVDGIPLDEWMSGKHTAHRAVARATIKEKSTARRAVARATIKEKSTARRAVARAAIEERSTAHRAVARAEIGERSTAHRAVARAEIRNPQSEIRNVLGLFAKICAAVSYAHQQGVAHRDLKPANILVDDAGEPHILDFGLAKLTDGSGSEHLQTVTGEFMGTPAYASPEQVGGRHDQIDVRSDVYTLGVILYEMLTGQFPYDVTGSVHEALASIAQTEPARPSSINPQLNDEIDTIILKALAKPRERRYQSAAALYEDVLHYLADEAIAAKRDSTWYILKKTARRYRLQAGLVIATFVFVSVLAVAMTVQSGRTARQRDRAVEAEGLADSRATELAQSLSESTIERGRTLTRLENIPGSEELLWREFLIPPETSNGAAGESDPLYLGSAHAYWALWELYAHSNCVATMSEGGGIVYSVASSPSEGMVASANAGGTVILWRVPSGEKLATLQCSSVDVSTVLFSPDGGRLLTRDRDGVLTLWDVAAKAPIHTFGVRATSACFAPDALTLAIGNSEGSVCLWDLANDRCVTTVGGGPDPVSSISFGPDGYSVAWSAGRSVMVRNGNSVRTTDLPMGDEGQKQAGGVKLSPEFLAFGYYGEVWRWVVPFETPPTVWLSQGSRSLGGLDISADGRFLATAVNDRLIRIWDTSTGQCLQTLSGHGSPTVSISFSPDGSFLASGGHDGAVRFWEIDSSRRVRVLAGHTDTVHSICLNPSGASLVSSSGAGDLTVRLWDVRSERQLNELHSGHTGVIAAVGYSPDGRLLATASYDHTVKLWDAATLENLHTLTEHGDKVSALAFSPDGRTLASGSSDRTVKLWDVPTGTCRATLTGHPTRIPQLCFSPDGETLAVSSIDKTLSLWDVNEQQRRTVLTGHGSAVRSVAFSPIGNIIASGSDDSTIKLWDPRSGVCLATLSGHLQDLFALAFSSDGRLLASGTRDGEILLWDVATRRNVLVLKEGGAGAVFGLCFTPDGRTLISAGADKLIRLWDLNYFQRHIAGNMEYNLTRFAPQMMARGIDPQPLRDWAKDILSPNQSP